MWSYYQSSMACMWSNYPLNSGWLPWDWEYNVISSEGYRQNWPLQHNNKIGQTGTMRISIGGWMVTIQRICLFTYYTSIPCVVQNNYKPLVLSKRTTCHGNHLYHCHQTCPYHYFYVPPNKVKDKLCKPSKGHFGDVTLITLWGFTGINIVGNWLIQYFEVYLLILCVTDFWSSFV